MQLIFIRMLTKLTPMKDILQNIQIHLYLNRDKQHKMHIQINSVLILEIDYKNLKIVENIVIKHIVIYLHPGSSNQIF